MFGLVHYIESFPAAQQISALFRVFESILTNAKAWLKVLHYRLLNGADARRVYAEMFKSEPLENRERVYSFLRELAREDPEFASRVAEITSQL